MKQLHTKREISIHGIRCGYIEAGEAGPILVLLHGWAQSSATWIPFVEEMKGCKMYALDLPGFGSSDVPPKPWGVADYAAFVDAFIRRTALSSPAVLGHSFGARVALEYASHYPPRKLVLYATGIARGFSAFSFFNTMLVRTVGRFAPRFLFRLHAAYLTPQGFADTSRIDTPRAQRMLATYLLTHAQQRVPTLFGTDTLLVYGTKDMVAPLASGVALQKHIPGASLAVMRDGGHFAHIRQARGFSAIINDFLAR